MPIYNQARPANMNSTDPWADAAKSFLSSGAYAENYMKDQELGRTKPKERPWDGGDTSNLTDAQLLARAINSEGASEAYEGQLGIGNVIQNRVKSKHYPNTLRGVIMQPGAFSAFNGVTGYAGGEGANDLWRQNPPQDTSDLAETILSGGAGSITPALNYYNPSTSDPKWGGENFKTLYPGSNHVFGDANN
jgi:spore germination cell wall hydrolase CwlJ-like protein